VNGSATAGTVLRPAVWIASAVSFGLLVPACSTSSSPAAGGPADPTTCSGGSTYHADTYAPGLTKVGSANAFSFVLVSADPGPPAQYQNAWILKLLDASGHPVSGATFSVKTWMPLHGHSSSVLPTVMSSGDGTYATSLYLFMPGLWQITFNAQAGSLTDSAVFTFCVAE
jgi:hypothetical protein